MYSNVINEITKIREDKADEIIGLLDLFGGHLSLNDVLETELPLLYQLRDAKLRRIKRQVADTQRAKALAVKPKGPTKTNNLTINQNKIKK